MSEIEFVSRKLCEEYYEQVSEHNKTMLRWQILADFNYLQDVVDKKWRNWMTKAAAAIDAVSEYRDTH